MQGRNYGHWLKNIRGRHVRIRPRPGLAVPRFAIHPSRVNATKTTLLLADDLRAQLKELTLRRGQTVTQLLTEGAKLILARYRGGLDAAEMTRRAQRLRRQFRKGIYRGPGVSDTVDELVYPVPRRARRR